MDSHGDNLAAEALRIRDGLLAEHEEIRQRSSRARNPHDESAEGSDENESETGGEGSDQSESQAQGTAGGDRPLCPHEIPRLVIRIPANRLAGRTADQ
ncbi:hypothetical protein FS749_001427 [Ceratobasidium sp. UAMH 11750]|nr:hypothetical protein FS749_001427 [Ceratobasidium sp. UAMH 11750]